MGKVKYNKISISLLFSKFIKKIQIPSIRKALIDRTAKVCSGSNIMNVQIGKYSYIGNFCTINYTDIGKFCSIADNCIIGGASHPLDWVSTSPVFLNGKNIMKKNFSKHEYNPIFHTVIGNDVWIGNNVLIKGGLVIADGAVIGMGSIVTKNIGPYEIWAGNPAKFIKKRFSEKIIADLLDLKWWDFSEERIYEKAFLFNDVQEFIDNMREEKK